MTDKLNICGTCKFRKHDTVDWYCSNEMSDYISVHMRYGDTCEDWEEKEDK